MNKKRLYLAHKWAGATIGFFLFLLAISGVGLTFREELLPRFYPELFQVKPLGSPLPPLALYESARRHLTPTQKVTNLYTSEAKDEAYLFLYREEGKSFPTMLTINPYTGKIVGEMSMIKNVFAFMLFLHANLFLGKSGSYLVGGLGVVLLLFIVSGVMLWLPQDGVATKLKRTFEILKGQKLQKLHHLLGLMFLIPLVISALTGFLTVFDLSYYLMRPLKGEAPRVAEIESPGSCTLDQEMKVLKVLSAESLKHLISIHFCSPKSGLMKITYGLRSQNFLEGYARKIIDPRTGSELQMFNSDQDPSTSNLKRMFIYPLHTGEYFGLMGRVLVLLGGLALMGIYLTGMLLFIRRRHRVRNVEARFNISEGLLNTD